MDEQQVAEEPEDDEGDRRHQGLRVLRAERVQRVGDHRRGRHDGDQLVDQRKRVAREHGAARSNPAPREHQLASPLRQCKEEREQRGAEEQPR
jgi:hypothetical protein